MSDDEFVNFELDGDGMVHEAMVAKLQRKLSLEAHANFSKTLASNRFFAVQKSENFWQNHVPKNERERIDWLRHASNVPLKALLVAGGTRGDVQPLLALAKRLERAGVHVAMLVPPESVDLMEKWAIDDFYVLRRSFKYFMQNERELVAALGSGDATLAMAVMDKLATEPDHYSVLLTQAVMAMERSDVIVTTSTEWLNSLSVAESRRTPFANLFMQQWAPSRRDQLFFFAGMEMSEEQRLGTYAALMHALWQNVEHLLNTARDVALDTPPMDLNGLFDRLYNRADYGRTIHIISDVITGTFDDVEPSMRAIGCIFADEAMPSEPDEALRRFVSSSRANGRCLLAMGFGSMSIGAERSGSLARVLVGAAKSLGCHAVIMCGWQELSRADLTGADALADYADAGNIMFSGGDDVPQGWLFKHVDALLIHGGAGSTALAFRSGKPLLVSPLFFDQRYHGLRAMAAGIGKLVPSIIELTVDVLVDAFAELLNPANGYVEAARRVGNAISAERGLDIAASRIAQLALHHRQHPGLPLPVAPISFEPAPGRAHRVLVVAGGSSGDTLPMLAMATRLLSDFGASFSMLAGPEFGDIARAAGAEHVLAFPRSWKKLLHEHVALREAATANGDAFVRALSDVMSDSEFANVKLALQEVRAAKAAGRPYSVLVVSSTEIVPILAVGRIMGVPVVTVTMQPHLPTAYLESIASTDPKSTLRDASAEEMRASHPVNLRYMFAELIEQMNVFGAMHDERYEPLPVDLVDRLGQLAYSRHVLLYSPTLLPVAPDQRKIMEHIDIVGAARFRDTDKVLPPLNSDSPLQQFIDAGAEPPVYIGWGSMSLGERNSKPLSNIVVEALMRVNKRGIVLRGWSRLDAAHLTDPQLIEYARRNVFFADDVPHTALLPQCQAILVHGGAGSTQAAFAAGKPIMVSPFAGDQQFFARLVEHHRVGFAVEPLAKVTVDGLSAAIERATSDDALKRRAAKLAERLQLEDGAYSAATIVMSVSTQHLRFDHLGIVDQHMRDHTQPSIFSPARSAGGRSLSTCAYREFQQQLEQQLEQKHVEQ